MKRERLNAAEVSVAYQVNGVSMGIDLLFHHESWISEFIWSQIAAGSYERPEIEAALEVIRHGDLVLEVGSGIGFVAAVVCSIIPVRWVGFEADRKLADYSKSLFAANSIENACFANRAVVDVADGRHVKLFTRRNFWANSLIPAFRPFEGVEQVRTITLSTIISLLQPQVLLCDVEGFETKLLSKGTLKPLRSIVVELHHTKTSDDELRAMIERLREIGFVVSLYSNDNMLVGTRKFTPE